MALTPSTTVIPSIPPMLPVTPPADGGEDISVTLTFTPGAPLALTEVDVAGDPACGTLLRVLDEARARLGAYIEGYSAAWFADEDPFD